MLARWLALWLFRVTVFHSPSSPSSSFPEEVVGSAGSSLACGEAGVWLPSVCGESLEGREDERVVQEDFERGERECDDGACDLLLLETSSGGFPSGDASMIYSSQGRKA